MKVLNEYPGSHHYMEEWNRENGMFCPACGRQGTLWTETGGDYYVGERSICTHCFNEFHLRGGGSIITSPNRLKILDQLLIGKCSAPTTPKGD